MPETKQPQRGRIFISYRRVDTSYAAGRIYDRLVAKFGEDAIFMDVDTIEGGTDFVKVLEDAVQSCDVLIALIGRQWLSIKDKDGKRRLDNPEDFVRIEIATALKRNIRVIPVLVDGVEMPRSADLPENLKALARRNALQVNHHSFNPDVYRLIEHSENALNDAEESRVMKAQAVQAVREKAEREAAEKVAREKAEREAAENATREKARLEAEEQAKREKAEKLEKEKTKREPSWSQKLNIGQRIDAKEVNLDELLQEATKSTESQTVQRKPGMQVAFWSIGFIVVIFIIGWALNNGNKPQISIPTSTNALMSTKTLEVVKTPTKSATSTPKTIPTNTLLPTATLLSGGKGRILFEKYEKTPSVYVVNSDGSELTNITNSLDNDYLISVSPDGNRILFRSGRDEYINLYIMETSGENLLNLTNASERAEFVEWSPDSSKVVFSTNTSLFLVNIDGSDLVSLTNSDDRYWFESWLPNGNGIILGSEKDGNKEVYEVNLDGSNLKNLTNNPSDDEFQSLSPDGNNIVFQSNRSQNTDIFIMNLNESNLTQITSDQGDNWFKSFSPDGSKMIFETDRDGNIEVYISDINGSNQINLSSSLGEDHFQDWMSDGNSILFRSNRLNNWDCFTVGLDGASLVNITKHKEHDYFLDWSPDRSKMLFWYEAVTTIQRSNESGYTWDVRDEDVVLYTMDSDGTNLVLIPDIPLTFDKVLSASWSLEGDKLMVALAPERGAYASDILIIDLSNLNIVTLENSYMPMWVQ